MELKRKAISSVSSLWRVSENLNTFSNLFIITAHYTYQHMPCIIVIVDCTHVLHVAHQKYQKTNDKLFLFKTTSM